MLYVGGNGFRWSRMNRFELQRDRHRMWRIYNRGHVVGVPLTTHATYGRH
jgi:hypothetical protein